MVTHLLDLPDQVLSRIMAAHLGSDGGGLDVACKDTRRLFLEGITSLTWSKETRCRSDDLAFVAKKCKNVSSVKINGGCINITSVDHLATLTGLRMLFINDTGVFDVGPLAQLTGLKTLFINDTGVVDVGLKLSTLTGLQILNMRGCCGITDVGPLSALTGLQMLDVGVTKVADIGPLSALTGLRTINVSWTDIADVGPLAALTGLRTLDASHTNVTDVVALSALTDMRA